MLDLRLSDADRTLDGEISKEATEVQVLLVGAQALVEAHIYSPGATRSFDQAHGDETQPSGTTPAHRPIQSL